MRRAIVVCLLGSRPPAAQPSCRRPPPAVHGAQVSRITSCPACPAALGRLPRSSATVGLAAGSRREICAPPSATSPPRSSSRRRSIRPRSGSATWRWRDKKQQGRRCCTSIARWWSIRDYAPALVGRGRGAARTGARTRRRWRASRPRSPADPSLAALRTPHRRAAVPRPCSRDRAPRAGCAQAGQLDEARARVHRRDRQLARQRRSCYRELADVERRAGTPTRRCRHAPQAAGARAGRRRAHVLLGRDATKRRAMWRRRSTAYAPRWRSSQTRR